MSSARRAAVSSLTSNHFGPMSIASIRALRFLTPLSAISSSIVQAIAIFTNDWLYTEEFMPNENYEKFKMPPEMEYLRKYTSSGLWVLCHNEPPEKEMRCIKIDYFSSEEYIPDQNDSTMAIPYAVKRAALFILLSSVVLVLGELIYLCRKTCGHRQICTFISGITFILAGLTILAGLVIYISTFKGEVSNKLRPLSEFQDALFHYRYGFSLLMLVASLILCEISGTLSIFLYIAQKQFQIMIDAEREEVLKKNILSLLAGKPANGDSAIVSEQPMLRIICEDETDGPLSEHNLASISQVDNNFLSADFGLDPSMYYCGRHGTRGRRNSRSNESFLGSESRSRKNSFTSVQDEPSFQFSSYATEHKNESNKFEAIPKLQQAKCESTALRELHVPSLSQLQPFRECSPMDEELRASKKTRFQFANPKTSFEERPIKVQEQEMAMPYVLAPSNAHLRCHATSNDQLRNRLYKQTSLNLTQNRSTFV